MSVSEHVHPLPSPDELAQLVGAATPHFAFQVHDRLSDYAASLPPDHPRQAELRGHLERIARLGHEGETGSTTAPDLPPGPSLGGLRG